MIKLLAGGITLVVLILSVVFLSASDPAAERAERLYRSGLALQTDGKANAALRDYAAALRLDGQHRAATLGSADILLAQDKIAAARDLYWQVAEQAPEDVASRVGLARIAIARARWTEAERYGAQARSLAPADPHVLAVSAALAYRAAVTAQDQAAIDAAVVQARAVLQTVPDERLARGVVIQALARGPDPAAALPELEIAIAQYPGTLEFEESRLAVYARIGDPLRRGAQLQHMAATFPDNTSIRQWLLDWYVSQDDRDGAVAFLRGLADAAGDDPEPARRLIAFVQETGGTDATVAELDRLAATASPATKAAAYQAQAAQILYDAGQTAPAIARLEQILQSAAPSDQTRDITFQLGRMQLAAGDPARGRYLVEQVLAGDPGHIEALKLHAGWLTAEGKTAEALTELRSAIDQNPKDTGIMVLMAAAYEKQGAIPLASEQLANAVRLSDGGPDESLQFYQFLIRTGRTDVARSVLVDAVDANPGDVTLVSLAAAAATAALDWPRAQDMVATLRAIDSPQGQAAAQAAETALQTGQDSEQRLTALLTALADGASPEQTADLQTLRSLLTRRRLEDMLALVADRIAASPDETGLRLLRAHLLALQSDLPEAEALFARVMAENPADDRPVIALYFLMRQQTRPAEATALLTRALALPAASDRLRQLKSRDDRLNAAP